jgi:hypothetical protein
LPARASFAIVLSCWPDASAFVHRVRRGRHPGPESPHGQVFQVIARRAQQDVGCVLVWLVGVFLSGVSARRRCDRPL